MMVDRITIIQAFHGYNPCLKRARIITGKRAPGSTAYTADYSIYLTKKTDGTWQEVA